MTNGGLNSSLIMFGSYRFCLILVAAVSLSRWAEAQLPNGQLLACFPPGGKAGTTFDVTVNGVDLDEARGLYFSQEGVRAVRKTGPSGPLEGAIGPGPTIFTVTVDSNVLPGTCEVRVVGLYGVTNPRAFKIGTLAEAIETEPNGLPGQANPIEIGTTVNGTLDGEADVDTFKIRLTAGQRIFATCSARSIDSRLSAVLVLSDPTGQELVFAREAIPLDPVIDFTAPADGEYQIKVYDLVYGGSPGHFYRLTFSTAPHVDFVLPAAVLPGSKSRVTLVGRGLPGGEPVPGVALGGSPLVQLPVELEIPSDSVLHPLSPVLLRDAFAAGLDFSVCRLPPSLGVLDPLALGIAAGPVVVEAEPNNTAAQAQKLTLPCDVSAQFYPEQDADWFTFDMKAGEDCVAEVISRNLGVMTDAFLVVEFVQKNEKGEEQVRELSSTDDVGGNVGGQHFVTDSEDPRVRISAPADGSCRVVLRDHGSATKADPRKIYRLVIRRELPDFRLIVLPVFSGAASVPNDEVKPVSIWNPLLRRGGAVNFDVLALRRDGFSGEIEVTASGLPPFVTCPGAVIASGANSAALIFNATADASDWVGEIDVLGRAHVDKVEIVRSAAAGTLLWPAIPNPTGIPTYSVGARSRVTKKTVLGVSSEPSPLSVEIGPGNVYETAKGGKLQVPVSLVRRGDFNGSVEIRAMGLPANVSAKSVTLDPDTSRGFLELVVDPGATPGTFSFYLRAGGRGFYSRNPDAVKKAMARKAELDVLLSWAQEAVKAAVEARAEAEKASSEAAFVVKNAAPGPAASASEKSPALEPSKASLPELIRAADTLKAVAEKLALHAEKRAKMAAEAQAAAAKVAAELAEAAKPQKLSFACESAPGKLRILAAPISLQVVAPAESLRPGGSIHFPVIVTRLAGFADAVQISINVPKEVVGLNIPALTLPPGQGVGVFSILAEATAAVGQHKLIATATAKFAGQDVKVEEPLTITVGKP